MNATNANPKNSEQSENGQLNIHQNTKCFSHLNKMLWLENRKLSLAAQIGYILYKHSTLSLLTYTHTHRHDSCLRAMRCEHLFVRKIIFSYVNPFGGTTHIFPHFTMRKLLVETILYHTSQLANWIRLKLVVTRRHYFGCRLWFARRSE